MEKCECALGRAGLVQGRSSNTVGQELLKAHCFLCQMPPATDPVKRLGKIAVVKLRLCTYALQVLLLDVVTTSG